MKPSALVSEKASKCLTIVLIRPHCLGMFEKKKDVVRFVIIIVNREMNMSTTFYNNKGEKNFLVSHSMNLMVNIS